MLSRCDKNGTDGQKDEKQTDVQSLGYDWWGQSQRCSAFKKEIKILPLPVTRAKFSLSSLLTISLVKAKLLNIAPLESIMHKVCTVFWQQCIIFGDMHTTCKINKGCDHKHLYDKAKPKIVLSENELKKRNMIFIQNWHF